MTTRTFLVFSAVLLLASHGLVNLRRADALRRERDRLASAISRQQRELRGIDDEIARLRLAAQALESRAEASEEPAEASAAIDQDAAKRWLQNVKELKRLFAEHPEQSLPQLQLLSDRKWVEVADDVQLETEDGRKQALAAARTAAKDAFSSVLMSALGSYLKEHQGELPPRIDALLPFVQTQTGETLVGRGAGSDFAAMLAKYQLTATGKLSDAPSGVIVKDLGLVDEPFDHPVEIARGNDGELQFLESVTIALDVQFEPAVRTYAAAHGGAAPASPADLLQYLEPLARQFIARALSESPPTPEQIAVFRSEVSKSLAAPPSPPEVTAPPN